MYSLIVWQEQIKPLALNTFLLKLFKIYFLFQISFSIYYVKLQHYGGGGGEGVVAGFAVARLVEAVRHKPEGCGFDFRWVLLNFLLTYSFRPHNDLEMY
jgi:hypothetical protein